MTIITPTRGTARPMSGPPSNEDGNPILLASWYTLTPPFHHPDRNVHHVIVNSGGIWACDAVGHLIGYGHMLSQRHGTPAEDLALLGYPVQAA